MIRAAPIRFVGCVLLLWVSGRLISIVSNDLRPQPPAMATDLPHAIPVGHRPARRIAAVAASRLDSPLAIEVKSPLPRRSAVGKTAEIANAPYDPPATQRLSVEADYGLPDTPRVTADRPALAPPVPLLRAMEGLPLAGRSRISGYGWAFLRQGSEKGLGEAGYLGGSQIGMRIDYAISPQFSVGGRLVAPTDIPGAEAALVVGVKPFADKAFAISVERRIALDKNGRNAFAIMTAAGIGPIDLAKGFRLETYSQAGIVGARSRDGFIEGSAQTTRVVLRDDRVTIATGPAIWGAVQPNIARLDVGPRLKFSMADPINLSATVDYRLRLAGKAAPKSGVAITLDGSF